VGPGVVPPGTWVTILSGHMGDTLCFKDEGRRSQVSREFGKSAVLRAPFPSSQ